MSWVRRLLLLAGLVTGAWLLGSQGEASADVGIAADLSNGIAVEVDLEIVEVSVEIATPVHKQPAPPRTPAPDPRTEAPPAQPVPQPVVSQSAPVTTPPTSAPQPQVVVPQAQSTPAAPEPEQPPRPQAERPMSGTLPQSGAGQSSGVQIPVGMLPSGLRPPATTAALISTEQHDAPRTVRAEEPTFSPD